MYPEYNFVAISDNGFYESFIGGYETQEEAHKGLEAWKKRNSFKAGDCYVCEDYITQGMPRA